MKPSDQSLHQKLWKPGLPYCRPSYSNKNSLKNNLKCRLSHLNIPTVWSNVWLKMRIYQQFNLRQSLMQCSGSSLTPPVLQATSKNYAYPPPLLYLPCQLNTLFEYVWHIVCVWSCVTFYLIPWWTPFLPSNPPTPTGIDFLPSSSSLPPQVSPLRSSTAVGGPVRLSRIFFWPTTPIPSCIPPIIWVIETGSLKHPFLVTSWSCSWYNHRCTIPGPPSCHVMRRHHAFQNVPPKIIVIRAGHATIYLTMPQRHCDNMLGLLWHAKRREQIIKAPVSSKLCCLHMFITTRQQCVGHLTIVTMSQQLSSVPSSEFIRIRIFSWTILVCQIRTL